MPWSFAVFLIRLHIMSTDWLVVILQSRQDKGVRVAVGSFVEGVSNTVEILRGTDHQSLF